jgi:hypothetical protein
MMNWLLDHLLGDWLDRRISQQTKRVHVDLTAAGVTADLAATMSAIAQRAAHRPRPRL